ncbi:hypothetical protein CEXT_526831 [Caerostris extrusa]|uniref:BTB domain-containing protein n=1 Tax=Caerostris extrusa TaxID=172846 RepID=A0AAV4TUY1_CAEEX|nr:hypothetical protein CEXT_526831 [Caerostris extrusa]
MVEKTSDCIDIPDLAADTFTSSTYSHLYRHRGARFAMESALDLYTAADKYELLALREQCSTYLKVNLTAQNRMLVTSSLLQISIETTRVRGLCSVLSLNTTT